MFDVGVNLGELSLALKTGLSGDLHLGCVHFEVVAAHNWELEGVGWLLDHLLAR